MSDLYRALQVNIHIHPVSLDHASRILKCLTSAGRSGCFNARAFVGAGSDNQYQIQDPSGTVQVRLVPRASGFRSNSFRKVFATLSWARKVKAFAKKLPAKCINVHGLSTLPLGVKLKRHHGCRLIYDTHELESKAFAVHGVRRLCSERLERTLVRHCDAVVCVSDGIADWYANRYRIPRPLVIRNVPDRRCQVVATQAESLRERCGVSPKTLLFLYQGHLAPGRQIERFIEVFAHLSPEHHLAFMGTGELEAAVRAATANHKNIHYLPAVPPNEVIAYAAQADIGLVGVENRCLSYYFSLPNKLFECLGAGVPVIAPDFPDMRRVIDKYDCGWSWSGDNVELASLIQRLSIEEIAAKKDHALAAGRELSWEREEEGLLRLYHRLLD